MSIGENPSSGYLVRHGSLGSCCGQRSISMPTRLLDDCAATRPDASVEGFMVKALEHTRPGNIDSLRPNRSRRCSSRSMSSAAWRMQICPAREQSAIRCFTDANRVSTVEGLRRQRRREGRVQEQHLRAISIADRAGEHGRIPLPAVLGIEFVVVPDVQNEWRLPEERRVGQARSDGVDATLERPQFCHLSPSRLSVGDNRSRRRRSAVPAQTRGRPPTRSGTRCRSCSPSPCSRS